VAGRVSQPELQHGIQVPDLVKDPTWSLRPWPVDVTLRGLDLSIPALAAADWLAILMVEQVDLADVLPGLSGEGADELLMDALLAGRLSIEEVNKTALKVLSLVSGRPWYVAVRIIATVRSSWSSLGGEFVLSGVDPAHVSLAAWLDTAYHILMGHMKENEANIFNAKLQMPEPGAEDENPVEDLTAQSFLAMSNGD